MTSEEIRRIHPNNVMEKYLIEVAAQSAEINENFKKFFDIMQKQVTKHEEAAPEKKPMQRAPLAEK